MNALLMVAVALQLGLTIATLACFVMVLMQMFRRGHVALGIVSIVIWPIAFVFGWINAVQWNFRRVMWVWTGCMVGSVVPLALLSAGSLSLTMKKAEHARTQVELESLATALDEYQSQRLVYPPSDPVLATEHVRRVYPRATERPEAFTDSSQALVFWLSKTSRNPSLPFSDADKMVFFEFEPSRLDSKTMTYRPPGDHLKTSYRYTSDGVTFKLEAAGADDAFGTPDDMVITRGRPG